MATATASAVFTARQHVKTRRSWTRRETPGNTSIVLVVIYNDNYINFKINECQLNKKIVDVQVQQENVSTTPTTAVETTKPVFVEDLHLVNAA